MILKNDIYIYGNEEQVCAVSQEYVIQYVMEKRI